jgi:hypothetical protein
MSIDAYSIPGGELLGLGRPDLPSNLSPTTPKASPDISAKAKDRIGSGPDSGGSGGGGGTSRAGERAR